MPDSSNLTEGIVRLGPRAGKPFADGAGGTRHGNSPNPDDGEDPRGKSGGGSPAPRLRGSASFDLWSTLVYGLLVAFLGAQLVFASVFLIAER
jgi:hypothetical protein